VGERKLSGDWTVRAPSPVGQRPHTGVFSRGVGAKDHDLTPRWKIHGERTVYDNRWVQLVLVDVEPPDGSRFEHHVVRLQRVAIGWRSRYEQARQS
jgi:hypothetical protein